MIVNSESSQSEWLAWTGVETQWPCGFQALLEAHVYGEFRDPAGIAQTITRGTHFDIELGVDGTVTAVPLFSMIGTHGEVRFHRLTPALKEVNFINLGTYSAAIHDYYYSADAMRDAEIRRDMGVAFAGAIDIIADDVSYPGGNVGLAAVNVRQGLDELAGRGLADLPDVNMTLGPAVDQYRVVWNNALGTFGLAAQSGQTGAEVVALINAELGGTTWQSGGTGGGGGEINTGSNVGTGGALGVYKAKVGLQLQFYGVRGTNGITAQLNASTNSIDYSLDLSFADARYVKAADLDDVAFTGAYSSLIGLPTLGALSAKNLAGFTDIAGTAIANLVDAQTGTAPDKLMTAQRVADAIDAQGIAKTRRVLGGVGLIGGGDLSADRTIWLGTPGTISGGTTNSVTESSHTHALNIGAATVIPDGSGFVGAYCLAAQIAGASVGGGATIAGSSLKPVSFNGSTNYLGGSALTGTWRNMGGPTTGRTSSLDTTSLWVRIS